MTVLFSQENRSFQGFMRYMSLVAGMILGWSVAGGAPLYAANPEYVVYEVHQNLPLSSQEAQPKEYFVNLGSEAGVKVGDVLQVSRRKPTYDLRSDQFYRDVVFPLARVKVIFTSKGTSICRLEKFFPSKSAVSISPLAIMVGDLVQPLR